MRPEELCQWRIPVTLYNKDGTELIDFPYEFKYVTTVHEEDSLMVEMLFTIRLVIDNSCYFLYIAAILR